ncbi:MAG: protein kinase [Myxococcales bacterium]|nr:protein kinase [Myxococcales bacterium]
MPACPVCNEDVLDIDVKCPHCGAPIGATGAHRMLGQVVLGQYELVDVLGQGGMSVVFKGKHKLTDQEVALKILPPELAAHSQVKGRFLEEAKALAALDHPNIVHLYNFGEEKGYFVLAMQFVQGRTWERIILENKRMDWKASCKIAVDVLRALEYAHGRGVIHRDMKPSNVLVRAHDAMATVMDFGIAKMTTSTKLTATGQTMGTVRYMSPEQVRGQEVDLRTDLYSLGATLYESLTGDTPFDGSTHFEIMTKHLSEAPKPPSSLGIELPEIVEQALMRSLAKKPDDRFENAREMRKVLEAALRQGDAGLVETQRLNRDILGEVRSAKQTPPAAARVATASGVSLADELEPGITRPSPSRAAGKKGKRGLWLALAGLVVAGGAATTIVLLKGKPASKPEGWKATVTDISGVTMAAGGTFDGIVIETVGKVTPTEIAGVYKDTVKRARTFAATKGMTFVEPVAVQQIVAVPQVTFCDVGTYASGAAPPNCQQISGSANFAPSGAHRLFVLADPTRLAAGMVSAVVVGICYFEPGDQRLAADTKHIDALCTVMRDFQSSETAASSPPNGGSGSASRSGSDGSGSATTVPGTGSAGSGAAPRPVKPAKKPAR